MTGRVPALHAALPQRGIFWTADLGNTPITFPWSTTWMAGLNNKPGHDGAPAIPAFATNETRLTQIPIFRKHFRRI